MSPVEQQRWSRLRELLTDLMPVYEAELTQTEAKPPAEIQAPTSLETAPPLEETVLSQTLLAEEEPEKFPIDLEESPPIGAEFAFPQEEKREESLSQALPAQEEPEKSEISLEESPPTQAQLAAEKIPVSPPVLDWDCSTRAFFESLPYEGECDYHREIPSQNWLSVPTAHFLEHLVPWYGLKHRHPDANLRQLVDLATQDAMKRAAQLQRLQTEEVTANAGHFFRNLNWQGVQRP